MGNLINYRINEGIVSSDGASPLSQTYYEAGSINTVVSEIYSASGSVQLVSVAWGIPGQVSGALQAIELVASQALTIQTNAAGTIGVQTVSITGTPTGGTFALGFDDQITAPIAYNAAASAVQTALQSLSSIGTKVTCSGGPLPGTAVTCTFSGSLITQTVPLLSQSGGGLTGGTSPAVVVANASGTPQDVIQIGANLPFLWSISPGYFPYPFGGAVTALYVTNSQACTLSGRILTY